MAGSGYWTGMREEPGDPAAGIPANRLAQDELLRELASVHRTRHETLRHGSAQALLHHDVRLAELEVEYLRRVPGREVDPERLAEGARARAAVLAGRAVPVPPAAPPRRGGARTGAEQPWAPEDLAVAEGRDPTAWNVERARRELAEHGPAAIERTVP